MDWFDAANKMSSSIFSAAGNIPSNQEKINPENISLWRITADSSGSRISCWMWIDGDLYYDMDTLDVSDITEFKEYHGVNVSVTAYLDKTRILISIDVRFDDVIYPNRVKMSLLTIKTPTLIQFNYSTTAYLQAG